MTTSIKTKILHVGMIPLKVIVLVIGPTAKGMSLRFLELLGQIFPENSWGCRARGLFYQPFLKKCGRNFQVALHAKIEHLQNIEVGNDVYIGHGSWISGIRGGILFEDEVMISPFVIIVSSDHTFKDGSARFGGGRAGRIIIGRGTWIASGVVVTAGVTVGASCLLAAGAVITKDVVEGTIVGGVPAKPIGKIEELGCVFQNGI